jgi:hypothetical protein
MGENGVASKLRTPEFLDRVVLLKDKSLLAGRRDQRPREFTYVFHQVWGTTGLFDLADDRAADHGGIRKAPDLVHLFWG